VCYCKGCITFVLTAIIYIGSTTGRPEATNDREESVLLEEAHFAGCNRRGRNRPLAGIHCERLYCTRRDSSNQ
jgi:hypothetical protein